MSLRKFMHERNKYKEEPNFKLLASLYPEFCKTAVIDLSGKIRINFKNEESLRILTKTLLDHDFNLKVEIPPKHLVPALPLRLNYILWIEDLLKHSGISDFTSIHGIDIGSGAICIYALLFVRMFKNKMICTDIDPESVNSSLKNIENNNLQDLIKVILVKKESILKELLEENSEYSFVMCNPPFFKTDKGLGKKAKQDPPRNAPTGTENELESSGGEREFILRLIKESLDYKDKIQIYTTMFGQKSSLGFLKNELTKKGIINTSWTEFCQGFTKRWGIAWTFAPKDKIDLTTAPVIRTRTEALKLKRNKSMEIIFPSKENLSCLKEVVDALKQWITELKIEMKEIELDDDDHPCWACQLIAHHDTWSHARRKRRMAMRQEASKKQCIDNLESGNDIEITQTVQPSFVGDENKNVQDEELLLNCTLLVGEKDENDEDDDDADDNDIEEEDTKDNKMLRICMIFESGHGGKLCLETLRQYLVNKLNVREFFHKQHSSKPNRKKRKKKKLNKD